MTPRSTARRWLPGRLVALLALCAALAVASGALGPASAQDTNQEALEVVVSASATTVPVGEAVTLRAQIANAPEGSPAYRWEMDLGGRWITLSTSATASYLTSAPETVPFRVTVSYGSGESATSNAVSVAFVAARQTRQAPPTPPAAPTGLVATPGNARVSLAWSDPSDSTISKYQIRRSTDGGTTWNPHWTDIPGSGAATTSHTVTGLTNATSYTFELRAVAGSVNGASARAGAMPAGPLVQNLNKYAVGVGNGTNTVANDAAQAFTTGSNAAGYRLTHLILGVALGGGAAEPTGYSVRVCNGSGGAPGSACDTLTAPPSLAAGGNLFMAPGAGIDLSPDTTYWIVFDSVSGGSGTVEMRRTADDGEDAVGAAGWTIADDGQSRGRAATGAWSSGANPHKVGVFGYARTAPAAPANLQVTTAPGLLLASVDWDDVAGADAYLVRWRTEDGELNDGLRPTASNTPITVEDHGDYVVQVQACKGSACGAAATATFEVLPLPPLPPDNFTLEAVAGGFEVAASWDAREGATSYMLAWVSLEGTGLTGGSQELTETSATVEVAGSGEWQFHLQACNDGGCGATLVETVDIANLTDEQLGADAANEELILIANTAAPGTDATSTGTDSAQLFTTGSYPGGYTIKRISLKFSVTGSTPTIDTHTVSLWSTTDAGNLDTKLSDFTNPATIANGFNQYTLATAHNLEPDTTYAILFDRTGNSQDMQIASIGSDIENPKEAPGWSIANEVLWRSHDSTGAWSTSHDSLRIAVFGAARAPAVPAILVSPAETGTSGATNKRTLSSFDLAQAFTTGGDTAGYVLTELKINMETVGTAANKPTYTLQVCSTDGSGNPTSTCHGELQGPSSLVVGANTFTPTSGGIVLNHNTTYAVVWDTTNGGSGFVIGGVNANDEAAGTVVGWSIADNLHSRTQTTGTTWSTETDSLKIAVIGRLKFATAAELLSAEIQGGTLILGYARGLDTAAPAAGQFERRAFTT